MLPPKPRVSAAERRLLQAFARLSPADREQLQAFAEFLAQRADGAEPATESADADALVQPLDIPRPASETVVGAIRRLSETFPMLDREPLLHDTSALMTAHVMQGRPAAEVIDELELMFRRHYERQQSSSE